MYKTLAFTLFSLSAFAQTVEEARLDQAGQQMPQIRSAFTTLEQAFPLAWRSSKNYSQAEKSVAKHGQKLWLAAKARIKKQQDYDDRALYWSRLSFTKVIHDNLPGFGISETEREQLIKIAEQTSRGMQEVHFLSKHPRILVTGFDPFLLDRRLDQSNPSGVNALLLDGQSISMPNGQTAQVEAVIFPVRYADFDQGIVEDFLKPHLQNPSTRPQLIATVSMGRENFDLERFPGRRRSSPAPDNLNIDAKGRPTNPIAASYQGQALNGPEFVEFSLPIAAMLTIQQPYKVNDNRTVITLQGGKLQANNLSDLDNSIAVEGGGGGYLSNEISYRSIVLKNQMGLNNLALGHIHTPAIKTHESTELKRITDQIKALLQVGIKNLMLSPS